MYDSGKTSVGYLFGKKKIITFCVYERENTSQKSMTLLILLYVDINAFLIKVNVDLARKEQRK